MEIADKNIPKDITTLDAFCSFAVTGRNPKWQSIFVCRDCKQNNAATIAKSSDNYDKVDDDENGQEREGAEVGTSSSLLCLCRACADHCHVDHDVEYIGMGPSYCDCGSGCVIFEESQKKAQGCECGRHDPLQQQIIETQTFDFHELSNTIPDACQLLIQEAQALVKISRDTFWIPASTIEDNDVGTLCRLERYALKIFQHHCANYQLQDMAGAEWWVQVKDLSSEDAAVDLHYDKDEDLADAFGLGYFPLLSTVTYLTDGAYPTLVFPHRFDDPENQDIESMILSHPKRGKHLVFDGRLLHGVPANLALCQKSEQTEAPSGYRVTFLVNLWQKTKPAGINVLPSSIRDEIKASVKGEESRILEQVEMTKTDILSVSLKEEGQLSSKDSERLELPFVSKGATWVGDDTEGPDLVLLTFPPPPHDADTIHVKFENGLQAYLDYQEDDDTVVSGPYEEEYV